MVRNRPDDSSRFRTDNQDVVVPTRPVVQLVAPATSAADDVATGATAATSGATVGSASASASASVRVDAVPKPPRTPEDDVLLPGDTISRLLPSASICLRTASCAPSPRPTVRITDEIPMTIPSMVSAERSRWVRIAASPLVKVSRQFTRPPARRGSTASAAPVARPPHRG